MRRRKKRRREKARKGAQGEGEADGVQANGHGPAEADDAVEAEDEEAVVEAGDELVLMQVRFCIATVLRLLCLQNTILEKECSVGLTRGAHICLLHMLLYLPIVC